MIAYFDCSSGVSGNMTVGALVDLGVDPGWLEAKIRGLGLEGYRLLFRKRKRSGIEGTHFDVHLDHRNGHVHRSLSEIERIIRSSDLPSEAKSASLAIFRTLGRAEAKVHRVPIDRIHFHEVGAVDALIDIVGASLCLHRLGVRRIHSSALNVGSGKVRAAHGWMKIPPPATSEMMERRGIPRFAGGEKLEMSTPTGVAILSTLAASFGAFPRITALRHGYGFGDYRLKGAVDALHAVLGREL